MDDYLNMAIGGDAAPPPTSRRGFRKPRAAPGGAYDRQYPQPASRAQPYHQQPAVHGGNHVAAQPMPLPMQHQYAPRSAGMYVGAPAPAPAPPPVPQPRRIVVVRNESSRSIPRGTASGGGGGAGTAGAGSWQSPVSSDAASEAGHGPGAPNAKNVWTKCWDEQYSAEYYYNTVTGESAWERPDEYSTDTDTGYADADGYGYQQDGEQPAPAPAPAPAPLAPASSSAEVAASTTARPVVTFNTPSPKPSNRGAVFTPQSASRGSGSPMAPMTPFSHNSGLSDNDDDDSDDDRIAMTPITPTPAPKPVQPKRTPTSIGNPPARSLPTPGNRRAASRIPVASPEHRRRDGGDSTPGAPEADGVAPTSPDKGSQDSQDSPASPADAATNAPVERVPHKQSPKAGASPRSSVDGGNVVDKSMHETVVARWKAAVESANETAALKRELVETKLRQEMDQLRLESEQRIRRLEKAAETKHAQDLDRVRAEVAAHERASYEEQLALLAQERQEVLSRYSAEVKTVKEHMVAERERAKAEAFAAGVESMRATIATLEKKIATLEARLASALADLDAKRDKIMDLENAAARSHSALIEAKSAAQVALLEARQQLTEEWTARQAQATGKLQERLSQREGEILALQTARSKERDDLHAQARAEYARGRDEVNKEWEAKTRTQASSQAQTTSMRDKAHAEELERVRTEVEARARAQNERDRVAAVDAVRVEMEALLQRETAKAEEAKAEEARVRSDLTHRLHEEQERATKEYYRGREEATREWSDKVQQGAVLSAKDADAVLQRRVAAVTEALKAEAEARLEKVRADAAGKLQEVKHQAQMASMEAAAASAAQLDAAQSALQASERARAAAEERASKAEAALADATAERDRLVGELDQARLNIDETHEKARAAVEKALASKRKYKTQVEHLKGVLMEAADTAQAERAEAVREAEEAVRTRMQQETEEAKAAADADSQARIAAALADAAREREALAKNASEARAEVITRHEQRVAEMQAAAEQDKAAAIQDAVAEALAMERSTTADALAAAQAERDQAVRSWKREADLRRKAHNRVLELQGNIRVMCRVRPVLPVESKSGEADVATSFPEADALAVATSRRDGSRGSKEVFEFDRVFQWDASQTQVFDEVRPLVTSVLDGYNVCIFAYGQTGSGKTHTMEGEPDDLGVNFRALEELFAVREARKAVAGYTFEVSVLEIYNEQVFDLLDNSSDKKALEIRAAAAGNGSGRVAGLSRVEVSGADDVLSAMRLASSQRAVGGHDVNERSSRSHSVVTVYVQRRRDGRPPSHSKLNLIDLAGSERVRKTNASGERLKEAQHINRSLSALGDVVQALGAKGKTHVPFRNSKLTYLLQDSLSHGSKVMMFVNVSPVMWNVSETLCSLRFAKRCASVQLGQAKKSSESVAHLKAIIADLEKAISSRSRRG